MSRVLVALSGGVDSSVAAAMLVKQGHDVIACIGIMHGSALVNPDVDAARDVARRLGIPFHAIDLRDAFEQHVVGPFCDHYRNGLTPSPCVECNRFVKFGALQDTMREFGCSHIATGHYARIVQCGGRFELHKATDDRKDQSYMLARLTQEQLSHTLFPLGTLAKSRVRNLANIWGFSNAERPESQDICFIPNGDYAAFIAARSAKTPEPPSSTLEHPTRSPQQNDPFAPGSFIDAAGAVLGNHRGIIHYTIGQRKGIGLAFGAPRYVCRIDAASNTVTIGTADELLTHDVAVRDTSWISGQAPSLPLRCTAKIRYRQSEQIVSVFPPHADKAGQNVAKQSCGASAQRSDSFAQDAHTPSVHPGASGQDAVRLHFDEPQRAVTPGQYAVLYDGTRVLGAGIIANHRQRADQAECPLGACNPT